MDVSILRGTPGFSATPDDTLRALIEVADSRIEVAPGETIYRAGDAFHGCVYLVETGALERAPEGSAPTPVPPGYLLGLSSYLGDGAYTATARAARASTVLRLPASALRALEQRMPELADTFDRFIGARVRERHVATPAGAGTLTASVRSAMSVPLLTCPAQTTLAGAVARMTRHRTGSLAIEGADRLVTFRSLAARLVEPGVRADRDTVADAAQPAARVGADDPLWKAQDLLHRTAGKYLLVEEQGEAVGLLSQTDVVRALATRQAQLAAAVHDAADTASLRARYDGMVEIAAELLQCNRRARAAVRSLSEAHLTVQSRCVELTLEAMRDRGAGDPPAPFALIVMGSGGRREMMLDPDQDNALILDDAVDGDAHAERWFEDFAAALNDNLAACGYIMCPGDIMARNPACRKSLSRWQRQIDRMSEWPNEKAARWSSIMFDFDTQAGDASLTRRLQRHVTGRLRERPRLLRYMVDDDAQGQAPLNWFNRLVATGQRNGKDTVDVKRNGLRMVANAARILALREGILVRNTSERIEALARAGVVGGDFAATLLDAYDELLGILLGHQIRQRRAGREPDKQVAPGDLTEVEREALRVSMRAVKRFQELLQDRVGGIRL